MQDDNAGAYFREIRKRRELGIEQVRGNLPNQLFRTSNAIMMTLLSAIYFRSFSRLLQHLKSFVYLSMVRMNQFPVFSRKYLNITINLTSPV